MKPKYDEDKVEPIHRALIARIGAYLDGITVPEWEGDCCKENASVELAVIEALVRREVKHRCERHGFPKELLEAAVEAVIVPVSEEICRTLKTFWRYAAEVGPEGIEDYLDGCKARAAVAMKLGEVIKELMD